jgi:peptidoglycan hydrolase-like protein with peptidoglycan-binding domain
VGAVVVVVAASAGVAAVSLDLLPTRSAPEAGATAEPPGETTPVTRMTLTRSTALNGDLGFGETEPVEAKGGGTVTWLPAAGAVVKRGEAVYRVDERPVVLLYGALPLYRSLVKDTEGADVEQFEANLEALGYTGFRVDRRFTAATETAVKQWQHALGVPETGTVEPGAAVYAPGEIRVAERTARVGGDAGGEILTYTGQSKVALVDVPAADRAWAVAGAKVSVSLPDGARVEGQVASVATEAVAEQGDGESDNTGQQATVRVTVSIADQAALGALDRTPVEIRYVVEERPDVLTVPVSALLAPADGGYALEVVEATGTRLVAVETGLFADGRVEVTGAGVVEGMEVRVPR